MVSIKKIMIDRDEAATALLRIISLFLEAMALHSVEYETTERTVASEREMFQTAVRQLGCELEQTRDAVRIRKISGDAIQSMETYNRRVERFFASHNREMTSIISLLTNTLLRLSKSTEDACNNLRRIGRQLEEASHLEDLRMLKAKLGDSLKAICEESERQEEMAGALSHQLEETKQFCWPPASAPRDVPGADLVTGPDGAGAVEPAVRQAIAARQSAYAVVLRVERLEMINSRYGLSAGDQLMTVFGQYLAHRLSGSDRLFRWKGPCFVAILYRTAPQERVRVELTRVASPRVDHTITIGNRSVMLPVSAMWAMVPLLASDPDEVMKKINLFTAEPARMLPQV